MTIAQTAVTSFKQDLLLGVQNFGTDTIKLALFLASADLDANTTVYATAGETSGTGYTAGGNVLTGVTVTANNGIAYVGFTNAVWSPASFTARGGLIYNASKGNKAIAVLDFGADKTAVNTFTVQMPANTDTAALLRIY